MQSPSSLPDFENPPLDEVALGLIFPPPHGFTDGLITSLWESVRADYPSNELVPRVDAPLEVLGGLRAQPQVLALPGFSPSLALRRWLTSADDQFVVQVQDTRFFLNWRKRQSAYPHFEDIEGRFWKVYDRFESTLRNQQCGEPALQQLEISYINWEQALEATAFFAPAACSCCAVPNIVSPPTDPLLAFRYLVRDDSQELLAALYVQCTHGRRVINGVEQRGTQLHLNFRAPLTHRPTRSELSELASLGHKSIVRLFTALTTEEAHKQWGRVS